MEDEPYPEYASKFPELGFYVLPGHTRTPRDAIIQVQDAEALGIGNVMLSERYDYKEASAICGAMAAATESIYIGTSATNLNTRHPVLTATMATTLNKLSNGRFALGLGKGAAMRWKAMGLKPITFQQEAEFVDLLRQLWRGEAITNFKGALGEFAHLNLAEYIQEDIPVLFVGFGPKGLQHAGRIYDGVHLHTFMNDRALRSAVDQVRSGEADTNRADGTVKVWSVMATTCGGSEEDYLKHIIARLVTYLQVPGYGDTLAKINGWDADTLQEIRNHPSVSSVGGLVDSLATPHQLEQIEKIIPKEWRTAAVGSPKECAEAWVAQLRAGADGVIIHASTPEEFAPIVSEYEKIRPTELLTGRRNRPA